MAGPLSNQTMVQLMLVAGACRSVAMHQTVTSSSRAIPIGLGRGLSTDAGSNIPPPPKAAPPPPGTKVVAPVEELTTPEVVPPEQLKKYMSRVAVAKNYPSPFRMPRLPPPKPLAPTPIIEDSKIGRALAPLGWIVPLVGIPAMIWYYKEQMDANDEVERRVFESIDEIKNLRKSIIEGKGPNSPPPSAVNSSNTPLHVSDAFTPPRSRRHGSCPGER